MEGRGPLTGSCTPSSPHSPGAHRCPAHFLAASGALLGAGVPQSLSCSSSFYPRRDSLATSSAAVQLPRLAATLSSASGPPKGPAALLTFPALGLGLAMEAAPPTVSSHSIPSSLWCHACLPPPPSWSFVATAVTCGALT